MTVQVILLILKKTEQVKEYEEEKSHLNPI